MASETIYAYVGPKGSGKTHEGVLRVVEAAKAGRGVVAIIPDLSLSKLSVLTGISESTLRTYVRVYDYDIVDEEKINDKRLLEKLPPIPESNIQKFWPSEKELTLKHGEDPSSNWRCDGWKSAIVRAGDLVVIDEAWRWLNSPKDLPRRFANALRMARHWRGPLNYLASPHVLYDGWHPGLGGPDGDGTELVSTNVLLLTQDYNALSKPLRSQVDQVSDIRSYSSGNLPSIVQRLFPFWRTEGRYGVATFASHILPDRRAKAYSENRKSWQIIPHRPEIHDLVQKAGGQALEKAIDSRGSLGSDERLGYIKYVAILVLLGFIGFGWWAYHSGKKLVSPQTVASSDYKAPLPSSMPVSVQSPPDVSLPGRVVGVIAGSTIAIDASGRTRILSGLRRGDAGFVGTLDAHSISSWSSPIGSSGRLGGSGVSGAGSGLAAYATDGAHAI